MALAKPALRTQAKPSPGGPSKLTRRISIKRRPCFAEFTRVKALKEIREGTDIAPAGSVGTIVDIVRGVRGVVGYIVEFTSPRHVVVSVRPSEIAAA